MTEGKPVTSKLPEVTPVEPEKKARAKRQKAPVYVYEIIGAGPTRKPVVDKDGQDAEFLSTAGALKWCKGSLKENGKVYEIVTVQRKFTVKAEPQIRVTLE